MPFFIAGLRIVAPVLLYFLLFCFSGILPGRALVLAAMPWMMLLPVAGLEILRPRRSPLRWVLYGIWYVTWFIGALAEVFLQYRYHLVPQSRQVLQSLANAPAGEMREYVEVWRLPIALALLASAAAALLFIVNARRLPVRFGGDRAQAHRGWLVAAIAMIILPLAAHANVVIQRGDPLAFWPSVAAEGQQMQSEQANLAASRKRADARVRDWQPVYTGPARNTFVLVLGESSNRWDWSLYGYRRKTNPQLEAMRDHLLVFQDVVSSWGSTVIELTRMLTPADHGDDEKWKGQPSVLGLAKGAGFKLFWLSNQSDVYSNEVFGGEADVARQVYAGRLGRHDASFDERLLPELDQALQDPAPLKFIVLHTLGSHEDYGARYPEEFDRFGKVPDAVTAGMASRWWWVRNARNRYDNSILYTDDLVARAVKLVKARLNGEASLLYVSDHGQDVGHLTSSFGHQFSLESGFTVPMIYWKSDPGFPGPGAAALENRPYQTDHLDWTLLSMLSVRTNRDQPHYDILGPDYRPWQRMIAGIAYVPGKSNRPTDGNPDVVGQ